METAFYVLVFSVPVAMLGWVFVRSVRSGMRKVEFADFLVQAGFGRSRGNALLFERVSGEVPIRVRHVFDKDEHGNRTERGWRVFTTADGLSLARFTVRHRSLDAVDSRRGHEVFDAGSLLCPGDAAPVRAALEPTGHLLQGLLNRVPRASLDVGGEEIAVELPVVNDPELVLLAAKAVEELARRRSALPQGAGEQQVASLPRARKL